MRVLRRARAGALVLPLAVLLAASARAQTDSLPPPSVTASSGAVQLTLRLLSPKVKLGEFPWYQIQIKNLGEKPFVVGDPMLFDPWKIESAWHNRYGIYLLVEDSNGELLLPNSGMMISDLRGLPLPKRKEDPAYDRKVRALFHRWKKQGLSIEEINRKLLEYPPPTEPEPCHVVEPGKTVASLPWHYQDNERKRKGWVPPPGARYMTELVLFILETPGKYRMRVVYDWGPRSEMDRFLANVESIRSVEPDYIAPRLKELEERIAHPEPEWVTFETPWLDFEVYP